MKQVRDDSPSAREFVKASGLLHLLRFGRFPKAPEDCEAERKTERNRPEGHMTSEVVGTEGESYEEELD